MHEGEDEPPCVPEGPFRRVVLRGRRVWKREGQQLPYRGGDVEGPLQTSFRRVKYLRVEDPQPTITRAGTRGDGDGFVNATGTLDVVGENLETATEIQLLRDSGELWQSVPATYFEGALTAVLDLPDPPCANGMVRVSTLGGSATYEVAYGDH